MPKKRAVLLQSGGLDSAVCASFLHWAGFKVTSVFINYGQSAVKREQEMAERISSKYGQSLCVVKIDLPWLKSLPIVGGEVKSNGVEEVKLNIADPESHVPLRNHLFISVAGSLAESKRFQYVCAGLNGKQDLFGRPHDGYVDTHKNFAVKLSKSMSEGSVMKHQHKTRIELLTPLMGMSKSEVIQFGLEVGTDFTDSWTCFNGDEYPCMQCNSCIGREEGFVLAGVKDPLLRLLELEFPEENLFQ